MINTTKCISYGETIPRDHTWNYPVVNINNKLVEECVESYVFLVVDDNIINVKILLKILTKLFPRCQIITTVDSTTVNELLLHHKFDLIFLDIEMPIISGIDIALFIRNHHLLHSLAIIAVTSRSNDEDLVLYNNVGIDFTLKKPLSYLDTWLLSIILSILHKYSGALTV
jgi:CheY-like chemotaxis protein